MKHKFWLLFGGVVSLAVLALTFVFTDPVSVGLFGILLVFAAVYYLFYSIFYIIFYLVRKWQKGGVKSSMRKWRVIAAVIAAAPVAMVSFLSLGGLNTPELLLIILLEVVAIFFISRRMN